MDCRKCGVRGHFGKFCNKDKKVAAVQAETAPATDSPQPEVRENSAIEFSFFNIEVENNLQPWRKWTKNLFPGRWSETRLQGETGDGGR